MRAPENCRTSSFFSWTSTEGSRTTHWLPTARVSEEIASQLDAEIIKQRSPSFKGFLDAAMNGPVL